MTEPTPAPGPTEASTEGYPLRYFRPDPVEYPRLAPEEAGIGGIIRMQPEDFQVEEIPLYAFAGKGEHCYLTFEKTNRTTLQAREWVAKTLGIPADEIGFAGFKDRRAVTRQTFSFPRRAAQRLQRLEAPWFHVVAVTYHRNKLRTGHLTGNRFRIRVREVLPGAADRARAIVRHLEHGLPNYYGPQRFGPAVDGHKIGSALLHRNPKEAIDLIFAPRDGREDDYRMRYAEGKFAAALEVLPPGRSSEAAILHTLRRYTQNYRAAARRIPKQLKRMYFSAYQASLFNWCLRERLEWSPTAFAELEVGDLAFVHQTGTCTPILDLNEARARAEIGELSPSGPIFGRKMDSPTGRPGRLERAVLEAEGMRPQSFLSHVKGLHLDGTRRPYRIPPFPVEITEEEGAIVLDFTLPPGGYATILLDQIMGAGRVTAFPQESEPRDPEPDGDEEDAGSEG